MQPHLPSVATSASKSLSVDSLALVATSNFAARTIRPAHWHPFSPFVRRWVTRWSFRALFFAAAGVGGHTLASPAAIAAETERRPNVILIVSDNQAWGDLGCFGSKEVLSPHLDRLAAEGVRGLSFYVTSGECTPSRASIMTGRYPQRNGMTTSIWNEAASMLGYRYTPHEYSATPEMTLGLDLREVTLGQMMKGAGYTTGAIGKWDTGRAWRFRPLQRGFDFFYGFLNTGTDYWTGERYGISGTFRNNELIKPEGFSEELETKEATGFIRQNRDRPFFLYLAYHAPAGNASLDTKSRRVPRKYLDRYPHRKRDISDKEKKLSPVDNRTEYIATISCMDDGVGEIMATLKELKLDANTLVIFFPDNGWSKPGGDPGPFTNDLGKQVNRVGEAGVRTSFIARWPGVLPAGADSSEFISSLDIFPTLAAVAKAPPNPNLILDGFDILPVLQGKMRSPRTEMFWHTLMDDKAARVGPYKWAETGFYRGLFDLNRDPGEKNDLSSSHPEILAQLKSRWENWKRKMEEAEVREPFRDH